MTTVYTFPILKSLDVTPQTAYEIISEGVQALRVSYLTNKALGNHKEAFELYYKVQQGERILHFIRINIPPDHHSPNHLTQE